MNFHTLNRFIKNFDRLVVETGLKRDVDELHSSHPNLQNDTVTLRSRVSSIRDQLDVIHSSDLPRELEALLRPKNIKPFTDSNYNEQLDQLLSQSDLGGNEFHSAVAGPIKQLKQDIHRNVNGILAVSEFLTPYLEQSEELSPENSDAILSLIFRDSKTTGNLKSFSKSLTSWSKHLPIYHQLIKSGSPYEVQIIQVQNGSIDLVINLDIEVAISLGEVFEAAFRALTGYLIYKASQEGVAAYIATKELERIEEKKEELLFKQIRAVVVKEINAQFEAAKAKDKDIHDEGSKRRIKEIADLVYSHVVKGNDFRILALPGQEADEDEVDDSSEGDDLISRLTETSEIAHRTLMNASPKDVLRLESECGEPENSNEE
ncbi:MAG: hypothetical protein MI807_20265 [Verrucomicrobiales bacterium]|nr:hypothetical protein [Verrucomicrobiales bacterium]